VTALFANSDSSTVQSSDAFDFNGDGTFTLADVTTLFNAVAGS
jgi:hypothetical protein